MTLQILLIFQAIQAFSLLVVALGIYNIWTKIEWEPNMSIPTKDDDNAVAAVSEVGGTWQTSEKKFRAKVYEDLDPNK